MIYVRDGRDGASVNVLIVVVSRDGRMLLVKEISMGCVDKLYWKLPGGNWK